MSPRAAASTTLTDHLYYMPEGNERVALDQHRREYEAAHGPTDLTKYYTSMWPADAQQWLFTNDPARWMNGLPEFAQDYWRQKILSSAQAGQLHRTGCATDLLMKEVAEKIIGKPACPPGPPPRGR
jgi:hypothetical protein